MPVRRCRPRDRIHAPLTPATALAIPEIHGAGMVKRYHASFPSLSYGFDSRYPLQFFFALPPFGLLERGFAT
jgi:hypothetical protein